MSDLISRQAAIDALDKLHYNDREDWCFVLDTIEHLPSAQPEFEKRTAESAQNVPNGELISRKAVIEALTTYIHNVDRVIGTGKLSMYDCRDAAESVIEELPSAQPDVARDIATIIENEKDMRVILEQPERKKGKWLRSGDELFPFECDQCSETNERTTPWCPHCGCKMEGEQP